MVSLRSDLKWPRTYERRSRSRVSAPAALLYEIRFAGDQQRGQRIEQILQLPDPMSPVSSTFCPSMLNDHTRSVKVPQLKTSRR